MSRWLVLAVLVGIAGPVRAQGVTATKSDGDGTIDLDPRDLLASFVADRRYLTDIPVIGRTSDAVIGAAPGAADDGTGVGFWGSSSLENRYVLDGADTTDVAFGGPDQTVPLEFLDEVRVSDGGSTGALVEAVTRHGTNEWHGEVFGTYEPTWLAAAARSQVHAPQTIDLTSETGASGDVGVALGGPIVKDRLWFFFGFSPMWSGIDWTRTIRRDVDRDSNGVPDVDPGTGYPITEVVSSEVRSTPTHDDPLLVRLDGAVTPEQQATLTLLATPTSTDSPGLVGPASTGTHTDALATDVAGSWRAELLDQQLELRAGVGWHRASYDLGALDASVANQPQRTLFFPSFGQVEMLGAESPATLAGCKDDPSPRSTTDPYPLIVNCPIADYPTGGPGAISRELQQRLSARISAVGRVHAEGIHELEIGAEGSRQTLDSAQIDSGGYTDLVASIATTRSRQVRIAPRGATDPRFDHVCQASFATPVACEYLTNLDDATRSDESSAWDVYARDVWHPLPELMIDGALRVENQTMLYSQDARGQIDPISGQRVPDALFRFRGNLAPRLGVAYDPFGDGRAKLFAHWGRYFEAVPLDLARKASGGLATLTEDFTCPPDQPGCLPVTAQLLGAQTERAVEDLRPEYSDELIAGGEYDLAGTVLGATFRDRRLHDVIEDVGIAPAGTYVIANPGEGVASRIDRPVRDYDAVELTATRRFSRLYVQASYTYSRTFGDYPGDISYLNDQIDPHRSTEYDFPVLTGNRRGALPQDRPQMLKVDAAYALPVDRCTTVVLGGRLRAISGVPEATLGPDWLYGPDELALLPPSGRTPFADDLDLHLAVRHAVRRGIVAELYADVFDVDGGSGVYAVDNEYAPQVTLGGTLQNALPISGGSYSDLIWAKQTDLRGNETKAPLGRNPHFHQPVAYYLPTYARLGFRLTF